jgi:hypothetical protein
MSDLESILKRIERRLETLETKEIPRRGGSSGGISLQDVYPVGSIYFSMDSTDPAVKLGFGSWEQIQGRFLVGVSSETEFNAPGKTGGAKTVSLTTSNLPSHRHSISDMSAGQITAGVGSKHSVILPGGTMNTDYSGSGTAHNNLPPYFAVYIWRRVSDSMKP